MKTRYRCIGPATSKVLPLLSTPTRETVQPQETQDLSDGTTITRTVSPAIAVGAKVLFESGVGLYFQINEEECFCASFPCKPWGKFYQKWKPDTPSHSDYKHIRSMTYELLNHDACLVEAWEPHQYLHTLVITNHKAENGSEATIDGILDWAGYKDLKEGRLQHLYRVRQTSFIITKPGQESDSGLVILFDGMTEPAGWRGDKIVGDKTTWIYEQP